MSISFIVTLYFNLMGPPSYMRSVVDRNVVMRRVTVLSPGQGIFVLTFVLTFKLRYGVTVDA